MQVNPLMTEHLHAGAAMLSATPILPEHGADPQGMQQHTHPTRLQRGTAMPLALLAHLAASTLTDARCIHQP